MSAIITENQARRWFDERNKAAREYLRLEKRVLVACTAWEKVKAKFAPKPLREFLRTSL